VLPALSRIVTTIGVVAQVGVILEELVQQVAIGTVNLQGSATFSSGAHCRGTGRLLHALQAHSVRTSTPSKPADIALRAATTYWLITPGISSRDKGRGVG
jgi:hypothetical protein